MPSLAAMPLSRILPPRRKYVILKPFLLHKTTKSISKLGQVNMGTFPIILNRERDRSLECLLKLMALILVFIFVSRITNVGLWQYNVLIPINIFITDEKGRWLVLWLDGQECLVAEDR